MSQLFTEEARRNPFPLLHRMRAASPGAQDAASGAWLLLRYADVERALGEPSTFSSRVRPPTGEPPPWLVFSDPPRHTRLRALVARAFHGRWIAALEPRVRQLSRALLEPLVARGAFDLVGDYAAVLPVLVIGELMGIPPGDRARVRGWSDAIVGLSHALTGGAVAERAFEAYQRATAELRVALAGWVEERRRAPHDDLLGRLVAAEVDGEPMGDDDRLGFVQLLLSAGTETTTDLVANALLCFEEHPGERRRVRAAPGLIPAAIEEVIRYRSPAQMVFRQTMRTVRVGDVELPADALVLLLLGSANRDPEVFSDPDRFDPTRSPNPHLGFGRGIHGCLGAALARLEAKIALDHLLLDPDRDVVRADHGPWTPRAALNVHGPVALPVRVVPRAA
jgi:cytochrome P450